MPNITIHGKRTETIYPFTVEYKRQEITGRYIQINEVDEEEIFPSGEATIDFDDKQIIFPGVLSNYEGETALERYYNFSEDLRQAIADYEKTR